MENEKTIVNEPADDMTTDYIAAINELKNNSVERSKYEQLRAENKKLLDSVINGTSYDDNKPPVEKLSVEELRKKWTKENQTNLEYIQNTLKLREAIIESGEPDPFLPIGQNIMPTDQDIATANKVAEILADCVEYADGDSSIFTNELQRRLIDIKAR